MQSIKIKEAGLKAAIESSMAVGLSDLSAPDMLTLWEVDLQQAGTPYLTSKYKYGILGVY